MQGICEAVVLTKSILNAKESLHNKGKKALRRVGRGAGPALRTKDVRVHPAEFI